MHIFDTMMQYFKQYHCDVHGFSLTLNRFSSNIAKLRRGNS